MNVFSVLAILAVMIVFATLSALSFWLQSANPPEDLGNKTPGSFPAWE